MFIDLLILYEQLDSVLVLVTDCQLVGRQSVVVNEEDIHTTVLQQRLQKILAVV